MCLEYFILINISSNGKIINLKMSNMILIFFENIFNKKVPLSGNSGQYLKRIPAIKLYF